jgi:anaerobic selenocysteine-containing dehydrogenase
MFGHQLLLPIPDIDRTDYLLMLGANPAVSNGSMMTAPALPQRLKDIRGRGGKVILIDPRRNETAALADRHLFIRPGTDALLLLSLLHVIFGDNLARGLSVGIATDEGGNNREDRRRVSSRTSRVDHRNRCGSNMAAGERVRQG